MKTFYHNITKMQLNETCTTDLIDNYSEGDVVFKSEAGNALLHIVKIEEIKNIIKELNEN